MSHSKNEEERRMVSEAGAFEDDVRMDDATANAGEFLFFLLLTVAVAP